MLVNVEKHRRLKAEAKTNGTITQLEKNSRINRKANRKGFSDVAINNEEIVVPNVKYK